MRKIILLITVSIFLISALLISGGLVLALEGDIHPNHYLFPLQIFSENTYAKFIPRPDWVTSYRLELTQRRLLDLALLAGTPFEIDSIQAVDASLQASFESYYSLAGQTPPQITDQLLLVLEQVENLASILKPASFTPDSYDLLTAKLDVYHSLLAINAGDQQIALSVEPVPPSPAGTASPTPGAGNPDLQYYGFDGLIPFFPGSEGWNHAFFPLLDSHSNLTCTSCHTDNAYAGTSPFCESCHSAVKPVNHFPLACETCHTPLAWDAASFSHSSPLPADCAACHAQEKPANHFTGSCSACHGTQGWLPASFSHQAANATDCQSCHTQTRPANHFNGQCSSCHSTGGWLPASFNHQAANATDCQSCHAGNRPANHFTGQCSSCHLTSAWKPANFNHTFPINHQGANGDCAKCHPSNPPAYNCFTCHNRAELDEKHIDDKGIPDYVSRCMNCHPDGRENDD